MAFVLAYFFSMELLLLFIRWEILLKVSVLVVKRFKFEVCMYNVYLIRYSFMLYMYRIGGE